MFNNKLYALVAILVAGLGVGAYVLAECGDSVCGMEGDEFVCYAENDVGDVVRCTAEAPCTIRCGRGPWAN